MSIKITLPEMQTLAKEHVGLNLLEPHKKLYHEVSHAQLTTLIQAAYLKGQESGKQINANAVAKTKNAHMGTMALAYEELVKPTQK